MYDNTQLLITAIIVYLPSAGSSAIIAHYKGFRPWLWFLLGIIGGFFTIIVLLALPGTDKNSKGKNKAKNPTEHKTYNHYKLLAVILLILSLILVALLLLYMTGAVIGGGIGSGKNEFMIVGALGVIVTAVAAGLSLRTQSNLFKISVAGLSLPLGVVFFFAFSIIFSSFIPTLEFETGLTDLHKAVDRSDYEKIEELLAGNHAIAPRTSKGRTPLSIAMDNNDVPTMSLLLKHGANPSTVLLRSIEINSPEIFGLLIQDEEHYHNNQILSAAVKFRGKLPSRPRLSKADRKREFDKNSEIVRLLIKNRSPWTPQYTCDNSDGTLHFSYKHHSKSYGHDIMEVICKQINPSDI